MPGKCCSSAVSKEKFEFPVRNKERKKAFFLKKELKKRT